LTFSFLIWMPFISFSFLITLVNTSRTILNKRDERRHPCFLLNLERKHSFSPKHYDVSCLLVINSLYYAEGIHVKCKTIYSEKTP
jgi:hypothetical protein